MGVCIVTGAAGAMGAAISKALTAGGHVVIGVDQAAIMRETCDEVIIGSVRDETTAREAFDLALSHLQLAASGELFLVNNAGVTKPAYPQGDEAWEQTLAVNLTAPFVWSRLYAEHVAAGRIEKGGIVFIGSLATQMGFPQNPAYQASKSGVLGLSRAFAYDLGSKGIRVNCVSPGYIATAMTAKSQADPKTNAARRRQTLLDRWGTPEDVAGVVAFLCSPASAYVTGTNLFVDGGWTCKGLIED
jgi:NAD(P)-dependent dehydrogenase (short-subunit alcohol dehydrogenase family)